MYSAWVPFKLTDQVKVQRVDCAHNIIDVLKALGELKYSLYAVKDETIVLFDQPVTKRGSRV